MASQVKSSHQPQIALANEETHAWASIATKDVIYYLSRSSREKIHPEFKYIEQQANGAMCRFLCECNGLHGTRIAFCGMHFHINGKQDSVSSILLSIKPSCECFHGDGIGRYVINDAIFRDVYSCCALRHIRASMEGCREMPLFIRHRFLSHRILASS